MGYIGSDPKTNESVSTAQLVDDSVTNAKIVDNVLFTSVTSSVVSASNTIIADTFTGTFSGALSSSAQISSDISGSFTAASSSFSSRTTTLESASGSDSTRITTLEGRVNQGVKTTDSPTFAGATVTGTLTANEIHTTFVSSSVATITGSNVFGDAVGDLHSFTGSVSISGSQTSLVTAGSVDISSTLTTAKNITVDYNDATSINAGEIAGDNDVLGINIKNQNTSNGSGGMLKFIGGNGDNLTAIGHIQDASNSASMLFFTETGGSFAERMRVDHTGALSVGTNSPATSAKLHIKGNGGGQAIAVFEDDTVNANVLIKASDANRNSILNFGDAASTEIGQVDYDHADNSMRFVVNATETIRIANTGDVGIGDNNPDGRLTVNAGANDTGHITVKNSDVAHSFTDLFANDTFCDMRKYSNAEGGMNIQGMSEGERGLALSNFSTVYDTPANGQGVDKGMQFFAYALSGNNAGNLNSNGTAFIFRARRGGSTPTIFIIDEDGDLHADGSTSITGFDYAEMFEWEDGNPSNEDRVGYSVVFGSSGDKIRVASGSEEPIGVVSARPGVIGDNPMGWQGKWKTDEWDRKIPKLVPMVSWSYDFTRGNGEVVQKTFRTEIANTGSFLSKIPSGSSERGVAYGGSIPSNANYYNKEESQLSDDYDATRDYTTRRGRKEWDTIGLMGKLKIRTGQATGSRWIKMKDVSDSIQLWLVK